jgi:hypothetical protein
MPHNGELLSVAELAVMLGLKPETVRWYSSQWPDRLPPRVQWSKKPMWDRVVVQAWMSARNGSETVAKPLQVAPPPVERPPRVVKVGRPRRLAF